MRAQKLLIAMLCGAFVAPAIAWQSGTTSSDLVLEIMARRYAADGHVQGSAGDHGAGTFDGFVYATSSGCGLGAGDTAPTTVPAAGWRFSGRVLGQTRGATGAQLAVRIEWERMWDNGSPLTGGPRGTHTLTMSPGNSVVLDRVTPPSTGSCQGAEARLEASVVARTAPTGVGAGVAGGVPGGVTGGVAAAGRGGRAGRGVNTTTVTGTGVQAGVVGGVSRGVSTGIASTTEVTGRGGRGRGTGTGTGTGASTTTTGAVGGVGRGVATGVQAGAGTGTGTGTGRGGRVGGIATTTTGTVGGVARGGAAGRGVASTTVAGGRGGFSTAVRPGTIAAGGRGGRASGVVVGRGGGTTIGAQFEAEIWLVHQQPKGPEQVQQQTIRFGGAGTDISFPPVTVNTSRGIVNVDITGRLQVTDATANTIDVTISRRARAAGSPPLDTTGWSKVAVQVTNPSEVLSFEFPPLQKATEDLLSGHKFSLRLRVNGGKQQHMVRPAS
jgi:hypothetical protein